jgi:hypothetical protein
MSRNLKLITKGSTILIVAFLSLAFLVACQNRLDKDEENQKPQANKGPSPISAENGQTVLTLDVPAQNRLGIVVTTLTETVTYHQFGVPGVVLPVQDLVNLRNSYIPAQTQLQKARVQVDVASKEYARLKTLFQENQNISEKAFESAEATLHSDEADERAGEQVLNLQESLMRQDWGSVVAKWAVEGSPELERILEQRQVLVQVTIPSGANFEAPRTILLEIPGRKQTTATLVSSFPRIDPRIQGRSFLYITETHAGLSPGVNLLVHLAVGTHIRGVIVPTSAVVWSEGRAWVFRQTATNRFTRSAMATDIPVENGFLVAEGFSKDDKVVTQGAQALLSEESVLQGRVGGEADEQ